MRPGTRVWYMPGPAAGARFAGVVLGPGTTPATREVCLCPEYWRFKRGSRQSVYRWESQPAVSAQSLSLRAEWVMGEPEEAHK